MNTQATETEFKEKVELANDILADLDKANKLGYPDIEPEDLASKYKYYELKRMATEEHDSPYFKY